ncbi:DUF108 domain-containing protein [Gulosibacter macacae]|uniref:DUF108 domain-containing protein n=1 Tax=Gulosibacter macacae TaxID=2488791 RepID=A0A3P3VSS7_9MICO|nr:aspartate dehydrogenase domain-containing protein [Gulosibacter macacae]RRJ85852.1 DUF108 domain-containing protein [Gulosibacter macacae]
MTRIALIGHGTIGRSLVEHLAPEIEAGKVDIVGALARRPEEHEASYPVLGTDHAAELFAEADLVVECAGVRATRELLPELGKVRALLLASIGILAEAEGRETLLRIPDLVITNGAIGGFDVLAAAAESGGLDEVQIRTRKLAKAIVQPWMSDDEKARIIALAPGDEPITVFSGGPARAIELFPANVNIAVALSWATRGESPTAPPEAQAEALVRSLGRVRVELLADPDATQSRHDITASGTAGNFEFVIQSNPSPVNPRTSGLTSMSVAHDVRSWLARR